MKITLVQTALFWEKPAENLAMFSKKLAALKRGQTDLVVLPEMFNTGFSMNTAALAEPMNGPTVRFLKKQARRLDAAVTGSFICESKGQFFNRLVFATPDGKLKTYDKRHLFSLAGENAHFQNGKKRLVVEWRGWRICPLVCYDLRFPVFSRNIAGSEYDLLIFIANWPEPRIEHWKTLLRARAIENLACTIGVNIIGHDGNGHEYTGDSAAIDHMGKTIWTATGHEALETVELELPPQNEWRTRFPALADADRFRMLNAEC